MIVQISGLTQALAVVALEARRSSRKLSVSPYRKRYMIVF
jgi:hypothetical protein